MLSAAARRAMAQDPRKIIHPVPIGDLRALDPSWTTTCLTRNHAYLVRDTLFSLDAPLEHREGVTTGRDRVRPARPDTVQRHLSCPIRYAG
jgi:peptide/nickel transport system substrate-binding protein